MLGFVRRYQHASGYAEPLEVSALVLDGNGHRIVLCGVDTIEISRPEVDELRTRVAEAAGADRAGVILNWNHTHCAPPGGESMAQLGLGGEARTDVPREVGAYIEVLQEKVVSVARLAAQRLEPAGIAWGLGQANLAVNRREKLPDGRVVLGWRLDGLVDQSVTVLQARREHDDSPIATVVNYGCHTVTVGIDHLEYSSDFPGPMREAIRSWTGGEAIFLQGAGGNVLPRCAFSDHAEAHYFGRQLALEALHAISARPTRPQQLVRSWDASASPLALYRWQATQDPPAILEVTEAEVSFPLLPLPTLEEIVQTRQQLEAELEEAMAEGADRGAQNVIRYHLGWARRTEEQLRAGTAPTQVSGPITAIRIGAGGIVTGPGEIFSEIGLAVKERSPARPTLYAGYSNGAISYFPTAAAYPEGGYEPSFGNHSYGLPAQVAPECERILVERAVRLLEQLFPECPPYEGAGWEATGALPTLPPEPVVHPG
jgi:hypothetical protein